MADVFEDARKAINSGLIQSWFDSTGSYVDKNEYFILSPIRDDNHVGSFHINLDTGVWYDHSDDQGGDFIKLVSLSKGISLKAAAEEIINNSGGIIDSPDKTDKLKKNTKLKKDVPDPSFPIPETAEIKHSLSNRVREDWCIKRYGKPAKIYQYKDIDNQWLFSVCRYEKKDDTGKIVKNFIPLYYTKKGDWYSKAHDNLRPYPPFGIEKIKDNDLPIIIVEGEKCGQCKIPGYNVLSWFGGSVKAGQTDWSVLQGRKVYIWSDADCQRDNNGELKPLEKQPGMKAAFKIKSNIPYAVIFDIYEYKSIEDNPDGWDLADCINEGIDPLSVIEATRPEEIISVDVDSYDMFGKFVELFYDKNSLEQNAGIYWHYLSKLHFWRKAEKTDIECNMQRWLEETKLHWIIAGKVKPTKFFNEMRQYLKHFSSGYIIENPYKDSAISPYLHVKNGALKISRIGIEFQDREEYGEDHFKELYPINCLDFDFDEKFLNGMDPEKDCPVYDFYIRDMIPKHLKETLSETKYASEIEKTIMMFNQIFAYSLIPIKPNEYFFGLFGNQNTGKSFFIKILKSLAGSEFCVERRTGDMDSRFAANDLWGKKVFIEPDLKTRKQLPEDFIKSYSGEQEISVESKYANTIHGVKTSLALFFVTNYKFTVKGTEGIDRRFIIIHYKNKLVNTDRSMLDKIIGLHPKGKESGKLEGKIFDERPAILGLAMKGWLEFCRNNFEFTIPDWAKTVKDDWIQGANIIENFFLDEYKTPGVEGYQLRQDVFTAYKTWCEHEGRKPLGRSTFYDEFRKIDQVEEVERHFNILAVDPDKDLDIDLKYDDDIPI